MQKKMPPSFEPTACNCLALRQAARHVSQIYDGHLTSEGLRRRNIDFGEAEPAWTDVDQRVGKIDGYGSHHLGRAIGRWSATGY